MDFLIVTLSGVFFFVCLFAPEIISAAGSAKRKKAFSPNAKRRSRAANALIKEFNALPLDNRPNVGQGIEYIVDALDVKHGIVEVDRHFESEFRSRVLDWNCHHNHRFERGPWKCQYAEYKELLSEIVAISTAIQEQQKALTLAGVQDGINDYTALMQALRDERKVISEITKEIA